MANVSVDTKALKQLGADIDQAKRTLMRRMAERGYQLLRAEVPTGTGNLQAGVAPPDVNYALLEATLTVLARSAETGPTQGKIFGKDGKEKKTVTLKPQHAFNYAEVVARGRKAFTAKGNRLGPKGESPIGPGFARALIIPVPTAPSGESYLVANGKFFIFRRSAKAVPANPFDERAAVRLEKESTAIAEAVLKQFV
ncbi:hypothetical protein BH10ACI2_BH10ACI2_21060 [soil metagenome]